MRNPSLEMNFVRTECGCWTIYAPWLDRPVSRYSYAEAYWEALKRRPRCYWEALKRRPR